MDVGVGVGVAFHTSCVVGTCSCLLAVVAVVVGSSSWPLVAVVVAAAACCKGWVVAFASACLGSNHRSSRRPWLPVILAPPAY